MQPFPALLLSLCKDAPMRISQLTLAGLGAWSDLHLTDLSGALNVLYSGPHGGKSTLARLVAHLLYGKADGAWRLQYGQSLPPAEGSVTVQSEAGELVLRRRRDVSGATRLTVSSPDSTSVDARTVQGLLGDLTPRLAAQLLAVDFAESPQVDALFSDPFAREFTAHLRSEAQPAIAEESLDRRRIDELIQQRNSIARQIEEHMQVGRRESAILDHESAALDEKLTALRQRAEAVQLRLHTLDARRTELAAQARYYSLEHHSTAHVQRDASHLEQKLTELEGEISRCRHALADLQTRSVSLRTELAQLSPDGTADRVTSLADGRATLVVVERLLDDLDSEVSQLARAYQPGRGIEPDAHARLTPLATLLRQQVYSMCGHWSEQERAVRRGQLTAELRQVDRAQSDLGERLEQLLARRETIVAEIQAARQPAVHFPQAPAQDYCRCERHGEFVQQSRGFQQADDVRRELNTLERERAELVAELAELGRDIARVEADWKRLQQERAGLLGGTVIEANRAELARLETILQQALEVRIHDPHRPQGKFWRASDVLAQLTNGRIVQIRYARDDARATIVDNTGRVLAVEDLSPAEHDQLYVALTLALAAASAARGNHLPLVLDEPFLRLDPPAAAVMAGVLEEFARAGHQVLVFTEDREARRIFGALQVRLFDLDDARQHSPLPQPTTTHVSTRLVRETLDGKQSSGLKLASGHGTGDIEAVFYLSKDSTLDEFPVLGSGTATIFGRLGIHKVSDLLAADPAHLARRLERPDIGPETVQLWQAHMRLLCHVPELTLNDAQLLTACGIHSPAELREAHTSPLWEAIEAFLASDEGRRFAPSRSRYTRDRIADWIYAAGGVREPRAQKQRPRRKVSSSSPRRRKRQ